MNVTIKTSLKLTQKRLEKLLTKEEISSGERVAVRATISKRATYVNAERLDRSVSMLEVGGNAEFLSNGDMVIDALVRMVAKGELMPGVGVMRKDTAFISIAPLVAIENTKGYFFEDFELRTPFLPVSDDIQDSYESLSLGIATVDIKTQKVVALEITDGFDRHLARNYEVGQVIYDGYKSGCIRVVCKMANGGCAFGCYVKE